MLKSIADIVTSVVDDFHTSDEEQGRLDIENKKLDLEKSKLKANIATQQTQINLQEAKHKSLFVAGWRPFIGWTAGAGLCYHFIMREIFIWILLIINPALPVPPAIDVGPLLTLVTSLLGLGALRTYEKMKGADTLSIIKNHNSKVVLGS